jgi:hypothetical protein
MNPEQVEEYVANRLEVERARIKSLEEVATSREQHIQAVYRNDLGLSAQILALTEALVELASEISGSDIQAIHRQIEKRAAAHHHLLLTKLEDADPAYAAQLDDRTPEEVAGRD